MDFYKFSEILKEGKKVIGEKDQSCDICKKHCGDHYVDGRTNLRPGGGLWANMCMDCWEKHGCGKFGMGHAQKYDNKTGEKVEG
jgi:hypothetical protein